MTGPRALNQRTERLKPSQLPPDVVYIGRALRGGWKQSKWHNPFVVGRDGTREEVIAKYAAHLECSPLRAEVGELRGKDLLCWCAPEACHGDLLLRLANA